MTNVANDGSQISKKNVLADSDSHSGPRSRRALLTIVTVSVCFSGGLLAKFSTGNAFSNVNKDDQRAATSVSAAEQSHYERTSFHQSGFGGIYNIAHPAGAKARRKLSETNVIIPQSANTFATPSVSRENIENLHGHYVHDEHRSPFASFMYNLTKEELEAEQADYVKRMEKVRNEWGAWDFKDEHSGIRPIANLDAVPYRDMKNSDFPKKSWQTDEKYVRAFIAEGRKLVDRVKEGIYAEYGWPFSEDEDRMEERRKAFEVRLFHFMSTTVYEER